MSPVCSHPSLSRASAVFSGSFKYPWNTFGPFTHTWSREEDRLRSLFYDIIKGCCLSELEKKVQQLWHWTPHLSFTVDWQVIHFCHIHQFDGVTGQRRSNVTCRQMISVQVISIHWNWHKKKNTKRSSCTCRPVSRHWHCAPSCAFSLTVAFIKLQTHKQSCLWQIIQVYHRFTWLKSSCYLANYS